MTDPFNMKKVVIFPVFILALFSAVLVQGQTAGSDAPTFESFLNQFPKAQLPFAFEAGKLQEQLATPATTRAKRLAWEYYQFLPELERSAQYSNMPVYPEPVAAFETKEYYAVLYNIARGAGKNTKTYSITVFSHDGQYIGTNFVAGFTPQVISAGQINEDLNAVVTEYLVKWTNDFATNGREGNSIQKLTKIRTKKLDLTLPGNPDQLEWSVAPAQGDNVYIADSK